MSARRHLGRGIDSVSHLFLSRRRPSPQQTPAAADRPRAPRPVLFVVSGSDVISKSVVTCNVALELARFGHTVAVVDADPNQPTLRLQMGAVLAGASAPGGGPPGADARPAWAGCDEALGVALFDTLDAAQADGTAWDYVLVNAPATLFEGDVPPMEASRVLLVLSAEPREIIHGYALVKRTAGWHSPLQLGIVVTGVADEAAARSLFDQFLGVLGRRLSVFPAYCGFLASGDVLGRSVLRRTPAVVGAEEPRLVARLRRIAVAVAQEFEPGGRARDR
jgi:MinD-like ATPase involved in chromosome partitioning or flagellar assembly